MRGIKGKLHQDAITTHRPPLLVLPSSLQDKFTLICGMIKLMYVLCYKVRAESSGDSSLSWIFGLDLKEQADCS